MAESYIMTEDECNCSLFKFYCNVAEKMGYILSPRIEFDCTKLDVTDAVREQIYDYYRNEENVSDDSNLAILWVCCGPKAKLKGDTLRVKVHNNFVVDN